VKVPVSFSVPLPSYVTAKVPECEVIINGTCFSKYCTGSVSEPTAAEGFLCVYADRYSPNPVSMIDPENNGTHEGGTTGAVLNFAPVEGEGRGTWAVRAGGR